LVELLETAIDTSRRCFRLISISSPRQLMKIFYSLYENNFDFILSFVIEIAYT